MTKTTILPELVQALEVGKLHYEVEQSITRTITNAEQEKKKVECGNSTTSTKE